MNIKTMCKESFSVIGKEGSTADGPEFIRKLWQEANAHFEEIAHLAKRDKDGNLAGIWGVMSDFSRSFRPWEDFNKGLYLAGAECRDDAEAPEGWTRWVIPGYEYLYAERDSDHAFTDVISYMEEHHIPLAGAAHDFTCPETGTEYMFFPIRRL